MNRREFVAAAAFAPAAAAAPGAPRTTMGIATTSYMTAARPRDTLAFLDHCEALGAAGIQAPLTGLDAAYLDRLRDCLRTTGMYFEAMVPLPKPDGLAAFDNAVAAARQTGAICIRAACLSGRRYETFANLADWRTFAEASRAAIRRALPVLERYQMPLALENHKDWTVTEMAALLRETGHPLLGVTLDTGNNISLLDGPMEVVETLAPWALSTHLKDMGVEECANGFLLAEVPLGEGILDLPRIVATIRAARPQTRFTLEMITRDPLPVPCLTGKYWATFPERSGRYLADTLRLVRERRRPQPLPRIAGLAPAAQAQREEDNVRACLHFARTRLGLA
jgi:3-oxoisoapionate decarboxylase